MDTQTHTTKTDGHSTNVAASTSIQQSDALMRSALEKLKAQLLERMTEMFANADEYLIGYSEIAEHEDESDDESDGESDHGNESYCEKLVNLLHAEQNNIESVFFKALDENEPAKEKTLSEEVTLANKLSLVDQDDMDEMVAVTAMYSNAMNRYEEEVTNLEARIEYLEITSNEKLEKYRFNPRHICEAYQTALRQTEMPIEFKLPLFKLFDHEVSSRLGDMYKALNQIFVDAGILPEVVYHVESNTSAAHSSDAYASDEANVTDDTNPQDIHSPHEDHGEADLTGHKTQAGAPGNKIPRSHDEISRFISQFMSGSATAKGEDLPQSFSTIVSEPENHTSYTRGDLLNALSKVQSDLAEAKIGTDTAVDTEQIKRAIIADLGRSHGGAVTKTVHALDQRCIDFVGLIFQAIAEDDSISMVITNLLMLLQIPIIKIAMSDQQLFSDNGHPARQALNLITKAGRGITDETDKVYLQLKSIVHTILHEHEVNRASFEKAVDELQLLISQENKIAAEKERAEQQEIIKQHARDVVLSEMRRVTKHKIVPKSTRPLLLKHWPTLMFNHYIHHGIESSSWLSSLELFNILMESLQPITKKPQWQKLKDNHESLVKMVSDELHKTRQNRNEIDAQIAALKQTLKKMLEAYQHELDAETPSEAATQIATTAQDTTEEHGKAEEGEVDTSEHDDKAARIEEQVRIAREKISRLPTDLHPGAWFEVFNGEDKPIRRLKLSVILTEVAKLVFVDRQGRKVIEKDADEFLTELNSGQSKLIADHSTFEHALGAVIHRLAA
ncbi:MAG: DUF1631 domain-containing protein [Gammaproteobacteria bacterium]|nr:DUF1631 domain-containing protein [Gammaproteobacteria bacterium]